MQNLSFHHRLCIALFVSLIFERPPASTLQSMNSYPNGKTAEAGEQPPPNYGFAQSDAGTPGQQGAYVYGQPQPGVYLQQPATYPQVVAVTNTRPPNSFLAWSIVSLIFFCLPLGIAALVFSLGVNTDFARGLHTEARRKSKVARSLNIAATVLGVAMWIVIGVHIGLTYNAYSSAYRASYVNTNAVYNGVG